MARIDGRGPDELRPVRMTPRYLKYPEGSVLIEMGDTKVICTASVDENVPFHKKGTGSGWVTAEYAMLPRSTHERMQREIGRARGRSQEIQRLIGRSLRAIIDLSILGERTIVIDCDVIQADGGTRTAAITGGYVALREAIQRLIDQRFITKNPLQGAVAAVSVGRVDGQPVLDLSYAEDSSAAVDMNVVMTEHGRYVEVQGTGEQETFTGEQLNQMLELARKGIRELITMQKQVLK